MYNTEMNELFQRLEKKSFFKLILGLGNSATENIKKISAVYSKAGADMFDLTPDEAVFDSVLEGIKSQNLDPNDFLYCVSFAVGDDKHGQKAHIENKKCTKCLKCIKQCPYNAIKFDKNSKKLFVEQQMCIGCRKCHCSAIKYSKQEVDICKSIGLLKAKYKLDCIELHISSSKGKLTQDIFKKIIIEYPEIPLSVCISREKFSDDKLVKFLLKLNKLMSQDKLIIQADGIAMSGGKDDFFSTLQSVANAQILKDLDAYILLSGGSNSKTAELARLCNVEINGVSIGSYGRLLLSDEINNQEFWYNNDVFNSSLSKAKLLVKSVKNS